MLRVRCSHLHHCLIATHSRTWMHTRETRCSLTMPNPPDAPCTPPLHYLPLRPLCRLSCRPHFSLLHLPPPTCLAVASSSSTRKTASPSPSPARFTARCTAWHTTSQPKVSTSHSQLKSEQALPGCAAASTCILAQAWPGSPHWSART